MRLLGATASHVGNVREANQDRVFFRGMVAALADGMGGHQGGERAAELAIAEFEVASDHLSENDLVEVVMQANRQVHGHAADNGLPGMGTTVVAMTLHGDETITVANVGDSRAYWLRGDYMGQVTEDHSFVEDLVRQGRLTPAEAATHPQRNILTRAIGIGAEVEVDRFPIPEPNIGDRFLLCSDGLFNELTEEEILDILLEAGDPQETASALVNATLKTPCRDNVTVAVVDIVEDDDPRLVEADAMAGNGTTDKAAKVITAPIPVVSKSVLHERMPNGGGAGDGQASGKASGRTGTLLLDEVEIETEDPETYLDTTELQIIEESPHSVQPRSRVVMGLVVLAVLSVVCAGGFFLARDYARATYFIADDSTTGELLIFQGRRDGFLGFDPIKVSSSGQLIGELDAAERATIDGDDFVSLQDAEAVLSAIEARQVEATSITPTDASDSSSSSDSAETSSSSDTNQLSNSDTNEGSSGGSTSTTEG